MFFPKFSLSSKHIISQPNIHHGIKNCSSFFLEKYLIPLQDMKIIDETQILCRIQGIYKLRKQREQDGGAENIFKKAGITRFR